LPQSPSNTGKVSSVQAFLMRADVVAE